MTRHLVLIAMLLALPPVAAEAQQRQAARGGNAASGNALEIGKVGAWTILRAGEGRSRTCFIMTQPSERLPRGLNRDPAYAYVLMRQGEANRPEFQVLTGYPLKTGVDSQVTIGSQNFAGGGQDKTIWLKNAAEETRLFGEMRRATTMSVKGTSVRGNETTDRYAITGFQQALERAQRECS